MSFVPVLTKRFRVLLLLGVRAVARPSLQDGGQGLAPRKAGPAPPAIFFCLLPRRKRKNTTRYDLVFMFGGATPRRVPALNG